MRPRHRAIGKIGLAAAALALLAQIAFIRPVEAADCSRVEGAGGFPGLIDYITQTVGTAAGSAAGGICFSVDRFMDLGYAVGRLRGAAAKGSASAQDCAAQVHRYLLALAQSRGNEEAAAFLQGFDLGAIDVALPRGLCGPEIDYGYALNWLEILAQEAETLDASEGSGGSSEGPANSLIGRWQWLQITLADGTLFDYVAEGLSFYVEFRADGSFVTDIDGTVDSGRWTFDPASGRLSTSKGSAGTVVFEDEGRRFVLHDDNGSVGVFGRF